MNEIIKDSIYFKNLSDLDFQAILRCLRAHLIYVKRGDFIVRSGDNVSNVFIVLKGQLISTIVDINGNVLINNIYNKDDIYGISYITQEKNIYEEDLEAYKDSILLSCDGYRFINPCENRCKRHISLNKETFKYLSKEKTNNSIRIYSMSKTKTSDKLLSFLNSYNITNEYFEIPFTKTELANYLGVERSSLSTVLNNLKRKGIIDYINNKYKVIK